MLTVSLLNWYICIQALEVNIVINVVWHVLDEPKHSSITFESLSENKKPHKRTVFYL